MNPIFLKKYDDIIVSVITTNNKVVNQDKQIVKFGPKLFISIKGPTVERLKIEEKLKEFHDAGKIKLRTYLEDINAVEIKLNGRINPETILLKAVR